MFPSLANWSAVAVRLWNTIIPWPVTMTRTWTVCWLLPSDQSGFHRKMQRCILGRDLYKNQVIWNIWMGRNMTRKTLISQKPRIKWWWARSQKQHFLILRSTSVIIFVWKIIAVCDMQARDLFHNFRFA